MQVSKVTLKETKVTMNPNDPSQQPPVAPPDPGQTQPPQEPEKKRRKIAPIPVWFSAAPAGMSEKDFHRDHLHLPIMKWVKRSAVVLVALAIIIGTGYGLTTINKETDRLSASAAANLAREKADAAVNYRGDGSDILQTAAPQVIYECPSGFTKKAPDSDECTKNVTTTVSGARRSCEPDQKSTGNGETLKCFKNEVGTLQVVAAAMITACEPGLTPSGNNCLKKEVGTVQKQYLCNSGQVPAGEADQTLCTVGPGALQSKCPDSSYTKSGSGSATSCSKSTPATKTVSYPPCPGVDIYWIQAPVGYCIRQTDTKPVGYCDPYPGFEYIATNNTCINYVNKSILRYNCPSGYSPSGSSCTKSTTTTQASKNGVCPATWSTVRVESRYICSKTTTSTVGGTPVYKECAIYGSGYVSYNATQCKKTISPAPSHQVYFCTLASKYGESLVNLGTRPGVMGMESYTLYCQVALTAIIKYNCNIGRVSGANCIQDATPIFFCNPGYTQKGSGPGSACPSNSAPTIPPTVKILCPVGFLPVGEGCEKTTITVGKRVIGCEDASFTYTPADSQCRRTIGGKEVAVAPKVSYVCNPDETPIGSGESLQCKKQEVQTEKVQKILKCEDNWKKRTASDGTVDCVFIKEETIPVD